MRKNWLGKLTRAFELKADKDHWFAVRLLMENQMGSPIKIVRAVQGGDTAAFFSNYILTGPEIMVTAKLRNDAHRTTFALSMIEPVGRGNCPAEAVLDLWHHMKSIPSNQLILRHEEIMDEENPKHAPVIKNLKSNTYGVVSRLTHASYTQFEYNGGRFINRGLVYKAAPQQRETDSFKGLALTNPDIIEHIPA